MEAIEHRTLLDLRQRLADLDVQQEAASRALNHAAGFLRSSLAHRLSTRTVPELHFAYDESIERGVRLSKLIDDALAPPAAPAKPRRARRAADR